MSDYFTMITYDKRHLLMCEKEDLVEYIECLRLDVKHGKQEQDEVWEQAAKVTGEKLNLLTENKKLKEENEKLKNIGEQMVNSGVKLMKECIDLKDENEKLKEEIEELKKRGEESLQLTMSQNEKFMDELEEKNKVIDTLKQEHRLELIKVKNANELYKGYACSVLTTEIQHDLCEQCMGQISINAHWLSKFLQEQFYEEIIPELLNEITDDGMYSFGGFCGGIYEIEHTGKGCISITEVERSGSDDE